MKPVFPSGRDGRRRPDPPAASGFGALFHGLGGLFDLVAELVRDGAAGEDGPPAPGAGGARAKGGDGVSGGGAFQVGRTQAVYGFSVKLGLGGRPVVDTFGTVREPAGDQAGDGWREPLVDVIEEAGEWRIIAEMPGVEADSVSVEFRDGRLHIEGTAGGRTFKKELPLPGPVAEKPEWSCRNGVLEVRLAKGKEADSDG